MHLRQVPAHQGLWLIGRTGMSLQPGCCHPTHAQRTKCLCGNVLSLGHAYGNKAAKCVKCGRLHRKESLPGGSFAKATGTREGFLTTGKRLGGKAGCPGFGRSRGDQCVEEKK